MRAVTLFSGQWADLPFETFLKKVKEMGFDGIELACWGDHFDVGKSLSETDYCDKKWQLLKEYDLECLAISNHLSGQAVSDRIDERHRSILPSHVWGDGDPKGVNERAAQEMKLTAQAAKKFGVSTVVGFTGSPIWHLLYAFPPTPDKMIQEGYRAFGKQWLPILDVFQKEGVRFALEVHPTEIAFDIVSAEKTLEAVDYHPNFGFNFDPSHLAYQGVDYLGFLKKFKDRIWNVHMKDVTWSDAPGESGVFGGHLAFGDARRYWDFRSVGRGKVDFEEIIRTLNDINYQGPLSVEWEDSAMEREFGAREACEIVKGLDFPTSSIGFEDAMT